MECVTQVVLRGSPTPAYDLRAMLLSLPANFVTTLETIPSESLYLSALPEVSRRWRTRLFNDKAAFKVGLAWAGNPMQKNDRCRSMKLAQLAPLWRIPGVSFYSLQKGAAAQQIHDRPGGLSLIDYGGALRDFAETAGLIEQLDLVISVDTSVAHLAGALGKPVWTMLTFAADWRWLLHRHDSPWYPSMRLFRQPGRGDWFSVVQQVAEALGKQVGLTAKEIA
jgi:hypothetical protein